MKNLNFKLLMILALFANLSLMEVKAKDTDAQYATTSKLTSVKGKNPRITFTGNSQAASVGMASRSATNTPSNAEVIARLKNVSTPVSVLSTPVQWCPAGCVPEAGSVAAPGSFNLNGLMVESN